MKKSVAFVRYFLIPIILLVVVSFAEKPAYKLYTNKGQEIAYDKMTKDLLEADVILFGELHNNPICHWLELSLLKDLHSKSKKQVVLGAEMFESDDQLKLDEYIEGKITIKHFSDEAKVWDNFKTDYQPLLAYAGSNKLRFVATNIPRRYASLVAKKGFGELDSLDIKAKALIPPLPIETDLSLPGYKMLESPHGHSHGTINYMPQAQAVKDVAMAHFILKNFKKGQLFLHFNGSYHSQNYEGIYWHLKNKNPELKIITIASVEQDVIQELEGANKNLADYIICIPSDMTKTY
jgi:uncharacterized iron-regulated protein